jgi:hypothetical protein
LTPAVDPTAFAQPRVRYSTAASELQAGKLGSHKKSATSVANNTGGVISNPIFMYCPQVIW